MIPRFLIPRLLGTAAAACVVSCSSPPVAFPPGPLGPGGLYLVAQVTETVAPSAISPGASNGVAAMVNGKVITKNEVAEQTKYMLFVMTQGVSDPKARAEKEAEARQRALDDLIDREVIISEFERKGAKIKPQYIDEDIQRLIRENFKGSREAFNLELKRQSLSWQKFREMHEKKLIVAAMRGEATKDVAFPTPDQKEQYFRKHEDEFREEGQVGFKTIAIPQLTGDAGLSAEKQREKQRKLANEIRRRLLDGADFASEARTYSQDSKAADGGDWGIVPRSTLAKQLADVVFATPVKSYSQVFEFRGLYYIIYVSEKRPGKLKPQAEIDDMLDKMVQMEGKKKANDEWIAKLRAKSGIRIFQ